MNVVKDPDGHLEVYLTTDDNRRRFKIGRYLVKEGYSYKDGEWIDEENKVITNKKLTDNLKNENGVVYEYVPFITKYNVIE
jgi:hypothetical protein